MSAIPAQTLLDESKCYLCYGVSQADALKLALLNRISSGSGSGGALVYRALLNQTGVAAPTATILQNSLPGTPVWSYVAPGQYFVTLAGVFLANKTFYNILACADATVDAFSSAVRQDNNTLIIITGSVGGGIGTDGRLLNTPFEILVYP